MTGHYLDNAATTPVRLEAAQAAMRAMTEEWGNPSARHALGSQAAERVKQWRGEIAAGLGCLPEEVVFTSCGTESDNWEGQAHHHRRERARGGAGALQGPGAGGL